MARRKNNGATYAKPTNAGTYQMSFNHLFVDADGSHTFTASEICTELGLVAANIDAIKITSIIVPPGKGMAYVDFAEGARSLCTDAMRPTKVKPSQLTPAGRWTAADGTTDLVTVYPHVDNKNAVINVAVRRY